MTPAKKDQIRALLKSIETGDPGPVAVVNEEKYIQHNPQTHEGSEGLAVLFKRLSETSPRVNIVRAFEDGEFVFAHTEYDFARRNIGFEVFRFEDGQAVEHWDNIQPRQGPNRSGRTMVDGSMEAVDHALTETNRAFIRSFVETVLVDGQLGRLTDFIDGEKYAEHNPRLGDGLSTLRSALEAEDEGTRHIDYRRIHRVLAEGNFVLSVCEGNFGGVHSSFYDLFRLDNGKVVEHWDTTEKIAPRSEWKNDNGKFQVAEVLNGERFAIGDMTPGWMKKPMPLHEVLAELSVAPLDNGWSKVTWSMDYRIKYGPFGWLLGQTMMKRMMGKVLDGNLKGLADKVRSNQTATTQTT